MKFLTLIIIFTLPLLAFSQEMKWNNGKKTQKIYLQSNMQVSFGEKAAKGLEKRKRAPRLMKVSAGKKLAVSKNEIVSPVFTDTPNGGGENKGPTWWRYCQFH